MMLGVRRPGVTTVIQELERAGVVARKRGHAVILDRLRPIVRAGLPGSSRVDARNAAGPDERQAYGPSIPDYLYRARGAAVSQRRGGKLNEAREYDQQTKHGVLPALQHIAAIPVRR